MITEKNKNNNLIVFNDFDNKISKTKEVNKILIKFDAKNSLLIVDKKSKENIEKATRNIDGKKDSIEVLDKIFAAKINKQLVSNVLYKTNANYKGRKAKTKQKNEITGSTAKIYSQKGTGNARHASKKAPIFVGGGVAHGPKGSTNYKICLLYTSPSPRD